MSAQLSVEAILKSEHEGTSYRIVLLHDARCMMQLLEGSGDDGGITLTVMQSRCSQLPLCLCLQALCETARRITTLLDSA